MRFRKILLLVIILALAPVVIDHIVQSRRSSLSPIATDVQRGKWAMNNAYGFPVWIGLNSAPKVGCVCRTIFLFIEGPNFNEDDVKRVFTGIAAEYPVPEELRIRAYGDREMLRRAIDNHLSTIHVNYGDRPEDLARAAELAKDQLPLGTGYFRADYIRREGGEKFSYTPDPEKVDRVTIVLKQRIIPYTGEAKSDFMLATKEGDIAKVKALLDNGVDINATNGDGDTALMIAALQSSQGNAQSKIVAMLLDKRADVNARNLDGWTALNYAASNDEPGIVSMLADRGADVNAKNRNGDTALTLSAYDGHIENVKILLAKGAHLNSRNDNLDTPLIAAAKNNNLEIVRILLSKGADLSVRNKEGATAMTYAQAYEMREMIDLLRKSGAKH